MYFVATFGPIEVGRITVLKGPEPYFVTINAVGDKSQQKPETAFIRSFSDFYEAKAYAVSFFPLKTQSFIQWINYD